MPVIYKMIITKIGIPKSQAMMPFMFFSLFSRRVMRLKWERVPRVLVPPWTGEEPRAVGECRHAVGLLAKAFDPEHRLWENGDRFGAILLRLSLPIA